MFWSLSKTRNLPHVCCLVSHCPFILILSFQKRIPLVFLRKVQLRNACVSLIKWKFHFIHKWEVVFLADLSQIQRTMYSFKSPVDIDHELNTAHLFSDRFFFIKKDCLQYLPSLQLPWVGFNSAEHLRKVCIVDNNHYIPISLSLCGLNLHSKACVRHLICSKLLLRGRTQCEWF